MKKPFIVDLYSGCGGFALGAELAGFSTAVAIDLEKVLQSSYPLNFPKTKTVLADIGEISSKTLSSFIDNQRPDGIIGGPPCQGFSRIGKRNQEDPRNTLIGHYFRHVRELKPKFFVMENVEGLLDDGTINVLMNALDSVSNHYTILDPLIINAADYGAPTGRKRVVIIGYDPLHVSELKNSDFLDVLVKNRTTVRDAISDLPQPVIGTEKSREFFWTDLPKINQFQLSTYATKMRKLPKSSLGWVIARNYLSDGKVSGLQDTVHTDVVKARYMATLQGKVDKISRSHKLAWDGLCPTLRAGTGSEKGSFQAVRPLHPDFSRVITVREAARLQGFPDWFMFHPTKHHSFRMIGNSVSPIVSQKLLSIIKNNLSLKIAA